MLKNQQNHKSIHVKNAIVSSISTQTDNTDR